MRVPNSFFGIRDFSYLRLGIRDNKAKSEILRGRWEGKNNPRDYGIARNFTGLKNPIGDPLLLKLFDARVPITKGEFPDLKWHIHLLTSRFPYLCVDPVT